MHKMLKRPEERLQGWSRANTQNGRREWDRLVILSCSALLYCYQSTLNLYCFNCTLNNCLLLFVQTKLLFWIYVLNLNKFKYVYDFFYIILRGSVVGYKWLYFNISKWATSYYRYKWYIDIKLPSWIKQYPNNLECLFIPFKLHIIFVITNQNFLCLQ